MRIHDQTNKHELIYVTDPYFLEVQYDLSLIPRKALAPPL